MDELKTNIIDSNIGIFVPCNLTGSETTTKDTEQTVDADAKINLGGASYHSSIDDITPDDDTNNTYANNDSAINKAKDETVALKLLCLHSVIASKTK